MEPGGPIRDLLESEGYELECLFGCRVLWLIKSWYVAKVKEHEEDDFTMKPEDIARLITEDPNGFILEATHDIYWEKEGNEYRTSSHKRMVGDPIAPGYWISPDGSYIYNVDPDGHNTVSPSIASRHHDYKYDYYTDTNDAMKFLLKKGWIRVRLDEYTDEPEFETTNPKSIIVAVGAVQTAYSNMPKKAKWIHPFKSESEWFEIDQNGINFIDSQAQH